MFVHIFIYESFSNFMYVTGLCWNQNVSGTRWAVTCRDVLVKISTDVKFE